MSTVTERTANIRDSLERAARAMTLRDSVGKGTATTRVRLDSGLSCTVKDNDWQFKTDMSPKMGGEGAAPDPGVYGRAAIGTCLATSIGMWAARCEIPLESVEVDIEADYDARGEFGVDEDLSPGYMAIRATVSVTSSAPEEQVQELLELAERHTSWLDNIRRPVLATTRFLISKGN
jgi:uncharacterized OsmC-like protein